MITTKDVREWLFERNPWGFWDWTALLLLACGVGGVVRLILDQLLGCCWTC
jgi:hypothetical protein